MPNYWFVHTVSGREGEGGYDLTCLVDYVRERQSQGEVLLPSQQFDPKQASVEAGDLLVLWTTRGAHARNAPIQSAQTEHESAVVGTGRVERIRPSGCEPEKWELPFAVPNPDGSVPTAQGSYFGEPSYSYRVLRSGRLTREDIPSLLQFQMRQTFYRWDFSKWSTCHELLQNVLTP